MALSIFNLYISKNSAASSFLIIISGVVQIQYNVYMYFQGKLIALIQAHRHWETR